MEELKRENFSQVYKTKKFQLVIYSGKKNNCNTTKISLKS